LSVKKLTVFMALISALSLPSVEAANQEIRALFQPDSSQPNKNVFVNKTPNSGYCAQFPSECADNDTFSIRVPIRFESTRQITPGAPADVLSVKVPANWRTVAVINQATGESETVEVRISGIGSDYILSDTAAKLVGVTNDLEGHQRLWANSSWVYAPSPCQYSGVGAFTESSYRFFWKTPVEGWCAKVAAYRIPAMSFDTLDFAYELRTPDPLRMSSGVYTGSLSYTVGPGGDFQMGAMMVPNDGNLTLDFVLEVQHTLKVDLPPGGNRVSLEPEGGWQRWLNLGQKPTKVYRDQPFFISASTRFKVWMECGESWGELGTTCNMKSLTSEKRAQFFTKLTLPSGITDSNGKDVTLRNLFHKGDWAIYQPGHYVDRKPGSLRFELLISSFHDVIQDGVGETFMGFVTVIWDSEV